ncbi:Lysine-specific demethylase 8 [Stagonosporopsis vannaccii]|nr:Lysine-specific demethylase 8 [Stagonosporopsis vannaccii]
MSRICRSRLKVPQVRWYSSQTCFVQAQCLQPTEKNDITGFNANEPAIFREGFNDLPAIAKWFTPGIDAVTSDLKVSDLEQHGAAIVPLELTRSTPDEPSTFERFEAPLSLLLTHMTGPSASDLRIYLAQHSLADLPPSLQADVPTPKILTRLGRGDIYASSLWMGRPPTRTPLHRDPNPNLFVQIAGQKVVRLMRPDIGRGVYERARLQAGGGGRANIRGEEMMVGAEMQALEEAVWDEQDESIEGVEAQLSAGDGLYIPLGWWHAVRGIGAGANASVSRLMSEKICADSMQVNWWFR